MVVSRVPFTQYNHFPTNTIDQNNKQLSEQQQKHIIVDGSSNAHGFYELIVGDNTNLINYKSFKNDYNKPFASLIHVGLENALYIQSYLVQNNKYIVVLDIHKAYNVWTLKMVNGCSNRVKDNGILPHEVF